MSETTPITTVKQRKRFPTAWVVAVGLVGLICAWLIPAVQNARMAARRSTAK